MDRRSVLAGFALMGTAPVTLAQAQSPSVGATPASPMIMNPAEVKAATQFYMGVIPRAELSLATSQIGVDKTTNKNAHEFAGFELGEAITVNMVLKDLGAKARR